MRFSLFRGRWQVKAIKGDTSSEMWDPEVVQCERTWNIMIEVFDSHPMLGYVSSIVAHSAFDGSKPIFD